MADRFHFGPKLAVVLGVLTLFIIMLIYLARKPFTLEETFTADPAQSYAESVARVEQLQSAEAQLPDLIPECGTVLMTHQDRVDNVIVFLHGFTNCPEQFVPLGEQYFNQGYNVLIPRQPRHGMNELDGTPLKGLTAEEMAAFGTEAVDIAQGLGDQVVVVGISGGGAITTWLAQERGDIDLAVPIAPFLGIGFIPRPLNRPLTTLLLLLPDSHQWWDPATGINNPRSAAHAYRGYYLHSLLQNLRLGYTAEADAMRNKPAAGRILLITNANDESVNNAVVAEFEQLWAVHGEQFLEAYQFDKDLALPHDLITVTRPDGHIEIVYPRLLELIH